MSVDIRAGAVLAPAVWEGRDLRTGAGHWKNFVGYMYTVFQKKTPTHIIGFKLRNSCLILIIFDVPKFLT